MSSEDQTEASATSLETHHAVTTARELDALGFEAVVLDPCGTPAICQRSGPNFCEWALGWSGELIDSETLLFPGISCTVLHAGKPTA